VQSRTQTLKRWLNHSIAILSESIHYLVVDFSTIEDIGPAGIGLMLYSGRG
jgi:anti-anti-sigma regulatory factor